MPQEGSDLQTVTVTTKLGAVYSIPDVDMSTFVLHRDAEASSFTLVNASNVVIVFPVRIIDSIKAKGVELWKKA